LARRPVFATFWGTYLGCVANRNLVQSKQFRGLWCRRRRE
jgi:hypothetical protein